VSPTPTVAPSLANRREIRAVARFLLGDLREEALTIGRRQRSIVAVKPDGCSNGCQAQALLDDGTGNASSGPDEKLKLRVKLIKKLRKKLRRDGRARATLQLSVTDSKTGAVATVERRISLRT
jgi:hypothetical protein